jgi:3-methyl-2-oxobutanoate hydroxymethyltransferase
VLEAVPAPVASRMTEALRGPDDRNRRRRRLRRAGARLARPARPLRGKAPRFVKRYADLASERSTALEAYVEDVREGRFPEEQHTYSIRTRRLAAFEAGLPTQHARRPITQ